MDKRLNGIDFARSFAVFGMVVVNYHVVLSYSVTEPGWLRTVFGIFEGRAAALFVILAGVGISMMLQGNFVKDESRGLSLTRKTLLKRALILFVAGLVYTPLWPADILHFYGIYILLAVLVLNASSRTLWVISISLVVLFFLLLFVVDYSAGWNWLTLEYVDFWTVEGMIRHLFYNGFHPVVPWLAFMLFGIWLGRLNLLDKSLQIKLICSGIGIALISELASWALLRYLPAVLNDVSAADIEAIFGTKPMPPVPLYMFSAGGVAVAVIVLSVIIAERFRDSAWVKLLVNNGRMALTLYIAHVVVGLGVIESFGVLDGTNSLEFTAISAASFIVGSLVFTWIWRRFFQRGPLEYLMRKLAG